MVPHQQGKTSLDSFSAKVMELVRLKLLRGTRCSNSADSSCRKTGLGFLKIIIPLQFSSSSLELTILSKCIRDQACSLSPTRIPGQGKAILEGFIIPAPYQGKAGAREASIIPEALSTWWNSPCSLSTTDNPFVLDLVTEITQIRFGWFRFGY